jgi:hypothetical protein
MTDRHSGYIVTLADDVRDGAESETIMSALRLIRGVVSVTPITSDPLATVARNRRDSAWHAALRRLVVDGPDAR